MNREDHSYGNRRRGRQTKKKAIALADVVNRPKRQRYIDQHEEEDNTDMILASPASSLDDESYSSSSSPPRDILELNPRERDGEAGSQWHKITNDLLFHMMRSYLLCHGHRANVLKVCRRWASIGSLALSKFDTSKALVYGVFVDNSLFSRLIVDPKLSGDVIELGLLRAICANMRDWKAVEILVDRATLDRSSWALCTKDAISRDNYVSFAKLCRTIPPGFEIGPAETRGLLEKAVAHSSIECIKEIVACFPEQTAQVLSDQGFAVWCCERKASAVLSTLVDIPTFRTVVNLLHVLEHSLGASDGALTYKIVLLGRGVFDPVLHGPRVLKEACSNGWVDIVKHLVINNKTVTPAIEGQAPLILAAVKGNTEIVTLLLRHPDTNPGYEFNRPIRRAMQVGQWETCKIMLRDRRSSACYYRDAGSSLLCNAIDGRCEDWEVYDILFRKKADPNQFDGMPIKLALKNRCLTAIQCLAKHGETMLPRHIFFSVLSVLHSDKTEASFIVSKSLIHAQKYRGHFISQQQQHAGQTRIPD